MFFIGRLEEVEDKFLKRPPREEDIEILNDLSQKLFEREIECKRLSEEGKHYKLELVNREENFNKVFNNSPTVGLINPIELSKVKFMFVWSLCCCCFSPAFNRFPFHVVMICENVQ